MIYNGLGQRLCDLCGKHKPPYNRLTDGWYCKGCEDKLTAVDTTGEDIKVAAQYKRK